MQDSVASLSSDHRPLHPRLPSHFCHICHLLLEWWEWIIWIASFDGCALSLVCSGGYLMNQTTFNVHRETSTQKLRNFYNDLIRESLADWKLLDVHRDGVSHRLQEAGHVIRRSVGVSRGLVLPGLDDGVVVPADLLAEITRNVAGTFLKQKSSNKCNHI